MSPFLLCHIDDFAYIPPNIINPIHNKLISSGFNKSNSRITISSSPNGTNLFYDLYEKSQRKNGDPEKIYLKVYPYIGGKFLVVIKDGKKNKLKC